MSVTIMMNNMALVAAGGPTILDHAFFFNTRHLADQHISDGRPESTHGPATPCKPEPRVSAFKPRLV